MLETTKYLKSLRARKGYDLIDMQELLPFHRVTYSRYENNPLKTDVNILFDIVLLLDGDIDEFCDTIKQDYLSCTEKKESE